MESLASPLVALVIDFLGVFLGASSAWGLAYWREHREKSRRVRTLTNVLTQGLRRNVVVLGRMRSIASGEDGKAPACPSQRIDRGHFDATIVSSVELLEEDPDRYEDLLNTSYFAAHINRRADFLEDLIKLSGKQEVPAHEDYCAEIVSLIDKTLPALGNLLEYLESNK